MGNEASVKQVEVWYEAATGFIVVAYPPGIMDKTAAVRLGDLLNPLLVETTGRGEAVFVLINQRHATGMSMDARKVLAEAGRTQLPMLKQAYVASFGGSVAFRVLANLIIRLFGSKRLQVRMESDEETARAWLTTQRRAYFAEAGKT